MLETKTALQKNATRLRFSGRAWIADAFASDDDRTEKICALDSGRPDRCWAAYSGVRFFQGRCTGLSPDYDVNRVGSHPSGQREFWVRHSALAVIKPGYD